MKMEHHLKSCTRNKNKMSTIKFISIFLFTLFLVVILFHIQYSSPFDFSLSARSQRQIFLSQENYSVVIKSMTAKLKDSLTFLPLKDLRFRETATTGHTWFMSSLNDTHKENEAEHLYFPSKASKGRLLCFKGRDTKDGTKNTYALAWREGLPDSAVLLEGLTFVSDTYFDHTNLWHGLCAVAPFVRWSTKNECLKPTRWVLFHWGELRLKMGSWIQQLMQANFGEVKLEGFDRGDVPYCFEKAVVMRHEISKMGQENKLKMFDLLRCKARSYCGINPAGKGREINERGVSIIRLTLLMRRGSRTFKNATIVTDIFAKECARVEGCILRVVQSEDLSFCDQVKVLTNTDIVASPVGAQLTNMLFMDRESSVMQFYPKGWLEYAGSGQYAYHWMANQSGMKHQGAWWDPIGEECPSPQDQWQCFSFHKDGMVGHNETHFAEWARRVIDQVRLIKMEQASADQANKHDSKTCLC
ncbi:putative aluminum-activated malate transporter 10-like [Capsicum annuum]|uniref:Glycosyltransferase 61 catalytic domain-containing protein n=1 Tax=Capsicum annuum TaxID=4072 RepID=A0A1U8GTR4_CAPAN|nr:uncharacterized protein LOC107869497 [Capsicum annuum]KAF3629571.1 putative aluminum-activated malate transporter 10-like [Capsicum annuum]PHT84299.1 hypothetical protein T459_12742 [Capsicum annuum]